MQFLEYVNDHEMIVDEDGKSIEPEKPEALHWLEFIEHYGLPYSGGWIDQPCGFMGDIEAARSGRSNYRLLKAINEENKRRLGKG